jgi:hypothetical protein
MRSFVHLILKLILAAFTPLSLIDIEKSARFR